MFDLPLAELRGYLPDSGEPDDFDAFWAETLTEAQQHDLAVKVVPSPLDLPIISAYEVTFAGWGGHRVSGLFLRPASNRKAPTVVHYLGYGDGTGSPLDWLAWPAAGCSVFVMDTRGQGARGRRSGRKQYVRTREET